MKLTPCLLFLLSAQHLLAQETPPPLPIPSAGEAQTELTKLVPGVLPEGTDPEAIALWKQLTEATLVQGMERRKVTSFRLTFDLRLRPNEGESHDANNTTYSFLAPQGFVRYTLESGRENMRGPTGDFTVTADGEDIKLEGREFNEDRRQLDEAVRIARNFVALTDPGSLRIQKLAAGLTAPEGLPASLLKRASELSWIEVVSPDFHLQRDAGKTSQTRTPLFRVLLGLDTDHKAHRPRRTARDREREDPADLDTLRELSRNGWLSGAAPAQVLRDPTRQPTTHLP